jgi:DNA anti-recombination protein RmuC
MSLLARILFSAVTLSALVAAFAGYRSYLLDEGYNKAVAEYRQAEQRLVEDHNQEVAELKAQTGKLQNAHNEKSKEVNSYRSKLSAISDRLREERADTGKRVEEATCGSVREYANAVTRNFEEARDHVERLGLEAAECSATAETLKKALDLANEQGLEPVP